MDLALWNPNGIDFGIESSESESIILFHRVWIRNRFRNPHGLALRDAGTAGQLFPNLKVVGVPPTQLW